MLTTAVTVGLLVFTLSVKTDAPVIGLVVALAAAVLTGLLYPSLSRGGVEQRLRKLHEEMLGGAGPFICEVELTAVGLWTRQLNRQTTYEWESVEEIKETEDSVDIYAKGGGMIVRKRAFSSPDEQKQFIELAESYLELSRSSSEDSRS